MNNKVVFILGSTRSGTSVLRNALWQTRYKGPGEGHLIGLVRRIDMEIKNYYRSNREATKQGTFLSVVTEAELRGLFIRLFSKLYRDVSGSNYVVDKTPTIEPILSLNIINDIWPDAQFVFCRRRGIDNIISKQRKFPQTRFVDHCVEWAKLLDLWDDSKTKLAGRWLEVEHYDLEKDPGATATRLAFFLNLDPEEEQRIHECFTGERPERTHGVVKGSFTPLTETSWTSAERLQFMEICSETMQRRGYGLETYWDDFKLGALK